MRGSDGSDAVCRGGEVVRVGGCARRYSDLVMALDTRLVTSLVMRYKACYKACNAITKSLLSLRT